MSQHRPRRRQLLATVTSTALVLGAASLSGPALPAAAAPDDHQGPTHAAFQEGARKVLKGVRPAGLAASGRSAFLLQLDAKPTGRVYSAQRPAGLKAARSAARAQLDRIEAAQAAVVADLPSRTPVLYKTHAVLSGVAVVSDVDNVDALADIDGVARVLPITPKHASNSYAVPLQGAPAAWENSGHFGQNMTVAVIDTGIDYTHANFAGPGTTAAYDLAHAGADLPANPALFPNAKIVGGHDFVGDAYDPDAEDPADRTPHADSNPLDCEGHGSHVAGTVAGFGVKADGTTYDGDYDTTTPFGSMKVGPGVAPAAGLMALKVFGCEGGTEIVTEAIDFAADPDGDPGTDDAVDVVNMSLGSDFGSPDDADAVAANAASALGITMAISSGNAYGIYDVGGSPGTAPRAITVAASVDAPSIVAGLHVTLDGTPATYASERSGAYDWETKPDLAGQVVVPQEATNLTGCDPFDTADAAAISGKIALLTWTDDDLECGSVARSDNVAAAGGIGFVFASNLRTFSAGITGSETIPGVLVNNAGGDAMRAAITGGDPVIVTGTVHNEVTQSFPDDDDKMTDFSSRGIRGAGNVKPDVTAVGGTVFSTAVGTGSEGVSESGTSMAAPMVAGLAALVREAHPTWTPEQVKADIMNTAGQDLDTNGSDTAGGTRYAPNRVGAGRIQAAPALSNNVLAYVTDDPGAVSVSWGPVEVGAPVSTSKTVKVENTGGSSQTYDVSYDEITAVPGVSYQVSPTSVTVAPGGSQNVTVTLSIPDPSVLTKTFDATHGDAAEGLWQQTLADASGNLLLTPTSVGPPELRVPVYSAPRPVSDMGQAAKLALPSGTGTLALSGDELGWDGTNGVGSGDTADDIRSIAAGVELQAIDAAAPSCSGSVTSLCISTPEDRGVDVEHVGVTSDVPLQVDPLDGTVYFGVSTHGPHGTFATNAEVDISIDTDDDGDADLIAFNTRLSDNSDVMVQAVYVVATDEAVLVDYVNGLSPAVADTAFYDSDVALFPVPMDLLAARGVTPASPRISYGITTFSTHGVIDVVAADPESQDPDGTLTADVYEPGLLVTDAGEGPFLADADGQPIVVRRDIASYRADRGKGLLLLHFHNEVGNKAQVVRLTTVTIAAPRTVVRGKPFALTVSVARAPGDPAATGSVTVRDGAGRAVASGALGSNGTVRFTLRKKVPGTSTFRATYAGNGAYAADTSSAVSVRITKARPTVGLAVSGRPARVGKRLTATVRVTTVAGIPATGRVVLRSSKGTIGSARLVNGRATFRFVPRSAGRLTLRAVYLGDATYLAGPSQRVTFRVRRR